MSMTRPLRDLPKCELHIHLEGAMRTETLADLCAKHGITRPEDTRHRMYSNFDAFASAYRAACECLRHRDDVFRIVRELLEDALAAGCRWVEVAPSLQLWCDRFDGLEPTVLLLLEAAAAAEDSLGGRVACAYIFSAERHEPAANAERLATVVGGVVSRGQHLVHGRAGIVGFGLHSAEPGNPPAPFAEAFRIAAAAGLAAFPHAGELAPGGGVSGADSVRSAVDDLGARRVAHGVLCFCDKPLVQRLAREAICLDVCPSSNVLLRSVPSLEEHPLPALLRAGVPVTINSDDPLLFGPRLLEEYEACRAELHMTDEELARAATCSFEHSMAPEDVKRRGVADVKRWLEGAG